MFNKINRSHLPKNQMKDEIVESTSSESLSFFYECGMTKNLKSSTGKFGRI